MSFFQHVLDYFKKNKGTEIMEPKVPDFMYTEEQLMARLKFFIGICLALTLTGIVFVVLYSIIFVTQPLNAISPIDQKFFELIIPIATFLTGTLSGIMLAGNDKDAQKQALTAANKGWDNKPPVMSTPSGLGISSPMGIGNPVTPQRPMMGGSMMGAAPMGSPMGMSSNDLGLMPGQSPKFTDD